MPKTTVTLNDVESKEVQVRGEDATVYTFKCSDGRWYTTFKRDVAVTGARLRGGLVEIDYTEKPWQKGEKSGTNYYLESIEAAVGDPGVAVDLAYDAGTPGVARGITSQFDKDTSIARAVALKAAVETATGLQLIDADSDAILGIANIYAGWLLTGLAVAPEPVGVVSDENFPF